MIVVHAADLNDRIRTESIAGLASQPQADITLFSNDAFVMEPLVPTVLEQKVCGMPDSETPEDIRWGGLACRDWCIVALR